MQLNSLLKLTIAFYCINCRALGANIRCISRDAPKSTNTIGNSDHLPPCVTPIENMLNGRFQIGDAGQEPTIPAWFNATLATIGQQFAKKYFLSVSVGMVMATGVCASQPDMSHTIFHFGGLNTIEGGVKRLVANILQLGVWYDENLYNLHKKGSNLIESVKKVRTMHLVVVNSLKRNKTADAILKSYKLKKENLWKAFDKDMDESYLVHRKISALASKKTEFVLNQFGMASQLWGFAAMPIIRPHKFGIPHNAVVNDEEIEGFLHFFALIGHLVGTEEVFNLCLQPNARAARIYFQRFLDELLTPYLFNLTLEAKILTELTGLAFTDAVGPLFPYDFGVRRILEDVIGIPCPNLLKEMTPMGKTMDSIWMRILVPGMKRTRTMRGMSNLVLNGYVQNLSLRVFGFDGTNKTIAAERAYSF